MNQAQEETKTALSLHPIAVIRTDFPDKFGIPRQSGLVEELVGRIVLEPAYRSAEALRGIEAFSHLWLIWHFTESGSVWHPTVRPPRLGGNTRVGVFASRSPFRPNPIGLSCVRLLSVEWDAPDGPALVVAGADLMDGTPLFDIKPYLPLSDCRPDAVGGYTEKTRLHRLSVEIPPALAARVPADRLEALKGVLEGDPRPGYADDPDRVYGFAFAGREIGFTVSGDRLTVVRVEPLKTE